MSNLSHLKVSAETQLRRQKWRTLKDKLARYGVAFGGISVIVAIVLIFFYLLKVVFPLFVPADMDHLADFSVANESNSPTLQLLLDEQGEVGTRIHQDGTVHFFAASTGTAIENTELELPPGVEITSYFMVDAARGLMAFGLDDGSVVYVKQSYRITYPDDKRKISPYLEYPMGEEPVTVDDEGQALVKISARDGEEAASVVALTEDNRLILKVLVKEESFMDEGEIELEESVVELPTIEHGIDYLLLDGQQEYLYVASRSGEVSFINFDESESELIQKLFLVDQGVEVTALTILTGGISLLVGDSTGRIAQWFPVRDENNRYSLEFVRDFHEQKVAITNIAMELRRKGFVAIDESGRAVVYHSTAHRVLLNEPISDSILNNVALSAQAKHLLVESHDGGLHYWTIDNEHPEVSWDSLWGKVWYESYPEPQYIWQSSSASNDFEPKFSLTPLAFGTLKAAFYAMLMAMPLAIFGAIYTAYFMAPKMRQVVKPSIEIMEALPTVILGFLAGLWLAPLIEKQLPGVFSLFMIVPFGIVLFGFIWHRAPEKVRHAIPEGWEAALLLPVVIFLVWLSFALSQPMEQAFFSGDMRAWLDSSLGVDFDQRNAVIVGLAMGFAVIPTIFSIAEDAIFSVPKHLTYGSLALGATPWQTLVRVVLLTASPGIFSAVMIGLGRAVGETMIVLMATGNTPIMDLSIFQGMRTLSANIAVEMPESELHSTHYRILFLAALVLFMFTFVFNTMAEIVRQRLRKKYSSL